MGCREAELILLKELRYSRPGSRFRCCFRVTEFTFKEFQTFCACVMLQCKHMLLWEFLIWKYILKKICYTADKSIACKCTDSKVARPTASTRRVHWYLVLKDIYIMSSSLSLELETTKFKPESNLVVRLKKKLRHEHKLYITLKALLKVGFCKYCYGIFLI